MRADSSGYFTIRSKSSWCMVRCGSHNTRPSHADMLHVDIWRNELNIAGDPGSYLYYHKPWNYKFQSTALHNTVTVDSLDQMERGPRFMWYKWNKSKTRYNMQDSSGQLQYFEGEHYGYLRLSKSIVHRRGILLISEDTWIIIDDLLGEGIHDFTLHWLLPNNSFDKKLNSNTVLIENGDNPYSLLINCLSEHDNPTKFEIIEGSEISNCYGWQSLYYGTKEKRKSILLNLRSNPPTRFLSVFVNNPDNVIAINNKGFLKIKVESGYAVVSLNKPGKKSILSNSIIKHNSAENILQIN